MMIYDYDLLSAISKVGRQNKTIPRAETVENQEKRKKKKTYVNKNTKSTKEEFTKTLFE